MARLYARNSKGRTALLPSPARTTRSHAIPETNPNAFPETTDPPPQSSRSFPKRQPTTKPRLATSTGANADSARGDGTSGDEADNDEDNDGDDDDEEEGNDEKPDLIAPSHAGNLHQTGRKISPLEYENELFADSDEDDDDIYEAVNDISDSDDGFQEESEEQIEAFDEQDILHEFLDNIDGLSAVGYGGDLDPLEALTAFSDESGSSTDAINERRVHFTSDLEQRTNILNGSLSPLLTRPLLPSALLEDAVVLENTRVSQSSMVGAGKDPWGFQSSASPQQHRAYYDDSDSDATDEDLPAEAHTTPSALHHSPVEPAISTTPSPTSRRQKSAARRRGPRLGMFQVDKDKSWGVFDPESEKIVILAAPDTGRYDWLEKRYQGSDDSASETPEASPAQLLDESDESIMSSQENPGTADLMLASLISPANANGDHGQATGPVEAFFPPLFQAAGDYLVGPENLDDDLDFSNEGDLPMSMTDLIVFDDEDDSDVEESPTSPAIYMPPMHELFGSRSVHEQFPHLNNRNVTAFRRSTDPARISNSLPSLSNIDIGQQPLPGTETRTPTRKRKAAPYTDKLYEGVTPTSRKLATPKRRKVMT